MKVSCRFILKKNAENNARVKIQFESLDEMKAQKLKILLIVKAGLLLTVAQTEARHKCPKVPTPPGLLGITTIPTLLPSGTFMAVARSSNTSGCGKAHPSDDFYRPSRMEMQRFIEDNHEIVSEETARGRGPHLRALARLAGCAEAPERFARILREHHNILFPNPDNEKDSLPVRLGSAEAVTNGIFRLSVESPLLSSSCGSS